jgi:hypothetical protein
VVQTAGHPPCDRDAFPARERGSGHDPSVRP